MSRSIGLLRFRWWHEAFLIALLAALLVIAGSLMPNFLNGSSQLLHSRQLWEFAILAIGMTMIILTGGIDLSVGSTMGLCAVAFGLVFRGSGSVAWSALACLATGTACGAANGALIAWIRMSPLIVTLATFAAFRGIAEGISQGASYSRFGNAFADVARGTWCGVPLPGWIFVGLLIAGVIFLNRTPTGRYVYALGHNEQAARFSGVPVDAVKFWLYTLSGLLSSIASLVYVSRFDTATADAGKGFELDVITAVVIGGTSIYGGRGNLFGTTLGLLLIHETRLFVSRYWRVDELRSIVIGSLLIGSVLMYRLFVRSDRHES
ncbi:MAG: ABC transporter permease [Pirellulaceae bacterium]